MRKEREECIAALVWTRTRHKQQVAVEAEAIT